MVPQLVTVELQAPGMDLKAGWQPLGNWPALVKFTAVQLYSAWLSVSEPRKAGRSPPSMLLARSKIMVHGMSPVAVLTMLDVMPQIRICEYWSGMGPMRLLPDRLNSSMLAKVVPLGKTGSEPL